MMNYLRIHKSYMLNKVNIIMFCLLIIILEVVIIEGGMDFINNINWFSKDFVLSSFIEKYFIYTKLISIPFISFLFGSTFTKENDEYHLLFRNYYNNKKYYYSSKVFLLILISIIIIYLNFVSLSIIGYTCSNWYSKIKVFGDLFLNIGIVVIIYGFISIIFSTCIPSSYSFFIPIILFVLGELLKDISNIDIIIYIYNIFIPTLELNEELSSYTLYGTFHLLILMFFYMIVGYITYAIRKS